jgi:hypothetical protein
MRTILFVFFILTQATVIAQWSPDPAINNAVCNFAGNQQNAQLVTDGAGGAIITWQDTRNGSTDIYAQHIDATGALRWPVDGIPVCTAVFDQQNPKITSDGAGGAIITWIDDRSGGGAGNYDIYAQRVDGSGTMQWTPDGVAVCTAGGIQNAQQLISDGSNGAIIVWSDGRVGSSSADIYAQRMSAAGVGLWTADGISVCGASSLQNIPQLASDGAGGAIIAWEDWRNFSQTDIYAQRVSFNGFTSWSSNGIVICSEPNLAHQSSTKIISDGSGGAILCWEDRRNFGSNVDIYAQKVNSSGATQWLVNGIAVCTAGAIQFSQQMIPDGAGGAIIAWEDRRLGRDIYAQRINTSGVIQWTANGIVVCDDPNTQEEPQLTTRSSGGAMFLWTDSRNGQPDIYAQAINAAGAPVWAVNGVMVASESHAQTTAQLIPDAADGAVIVWQDLRSTFDYDVYASRLSGNGALPVHLLSFTLSYNDAIVMLQWKTTNESNNSGFGIQRSADGSNWITLDFVPADKPATGIITYKWNDRLPLAGKSYYRLKQTDKDGRYEYSKILSVDVHQAERVTIYPNPAHEKLVAQFGRTITGKLVLYNMQGQTVLTMPVSNQLSATLNVKGLTPGTYALQVLANDDRRNYKIVIE